MECDDLKKEKQISLQTSAFPARTMHRLAEVLMRGFRMRNWSNFAWLVFIASALFSSKIISFLILKLLTGKPNPSHGRGLSKITVCEEDGRPKVWHNNVLVFNSKGVKILIDLE